MIYYYIIFVLIWVPALFQFVLKKNIEVINGAVFFIVFSFVVLRYQTGRDWNAYEDLFHAVGGFGEDSFGDLLLLSIVYSKELLFVWLNAILKVFANNYVIIQIFSGFVLFYGMFKFLKIASSQYALVFAITFSWLMSSLYFSTVRQSISVGLFFLFWVIITGRRKWLAYMVMILAIGIQYSSILYFLFYYMSTKDIVYIHRVKFWYLSVFILLLFFLGFDLAPFLLERFPTFGIQFVADKLEWYSEVRDHHVNIVGLVFVTVFTLVIGLGLISAKNVVFGNRHALYIYNFVVLFLPFQVIFINYAVFRNRVLYVGMLLALVILAEHFAKKKIFDRLLVFSIAFILSSSYISLFLMSSSGSPYVPYQSVIGVALTEFHGDGYERLMRYTRLHQ